MARNTSTDPTQADVVMSVNELNGRVVWTEAGERIGTVRDVHTDDSGRIVSLDVRERWMLGPHHEVPATGMRFDDGDVIVPSTSMSETHDHDHHDDRATPAMQSAVAGTRSMPVMLAGRNGARGRFGGLDLLSSFFGALVTIAGVLIIGGVLAAIFGTAAPTQFDTSLASLEDLFDEALLIGGATLLVSSFLGGWATGRSARFDGIGNGLMSVVWVLVIGLALGAAGAWVGDEYNVFAGAELPTVTNDELAMWGIAMVVGALALMLLGAALGGALGESWHRKADRAMLDVVSVDDVDATRSTGQVGTPVAPQPIIDDSDPIERDARSEDRTGE